MLVYIDIVEQFPDLPAACFWAELGIDGELPAPELPLLCDGQISTKSCCKDRLHGLLCVHYCSLQGAPEYARKR